MYSAATPAKHRKTIRVLSSFGFLGLTFVLSALAHPKIAPPPTPEPAATSEISDPRWGQLTEDLQNQVTKFPGKISIYIKDLRSGRQWSHAPDDFYPSASLIKLPIMVCVFKQIEEGSLSLLTPLKLKRELRAGGSGTLKWHRNGEKFAVGELVYHMITESDNIATKILVHTLGTPYLQNSFLSLGLINTNIHEQGFGLSSRPVLHENYTTAREMGTLLEKIYRKELFNPVASETMLEILKDQKHRDRLGRTLPSGWTIADKTGLLRRACHDAGIIFSPEGDYVLVVLTWKAPNYKLAKRFIAKVGKITYRYFAGESDVATTDKTTLAKRL